MAIVFLDADGTLLPFGASTDMPLPFEASDDSPSVEDRYFGLHPKTRSVVAWAGGEDFAWVDDEITEADREWVAEHHCPTRSPRRVFVECANVLI